MIPGYSILSPILSTYLGIDTSLLVSTILALVALFTFTKYVWSKVLRPLVTCSVSVSSEDEMYEVLMMWVAGQQVTERSRTLIASTKKGRWEDGGDRAWANYLSGGGGVKKIAPRYEPAYGVHRFWFQRHYFMLSRQIKPVQQPEFRFRGPETGDQETLTLTCVSFTTAPLKSLLSSATDAYLERKASRTSIRIPSSSGHNNWRRLSSIPSRSLSTLSLPDSQKEALIADLRRFLHPDEQTWYKERGIPYRRGYLFYGPPGTGKTSLSHVLAGVFGLDIHVVNLLEPTLSEYKLTSLFQNLPQRCIVLLEDIDSAGFEKRTPSAGHPGSKEGKEGGGKRTRETKMHGGPESMSEGGISLSCLLNVIDGLVAHEGRVLFMTTNFPEKLDAALVRAGRVDMKVHLELATRTQIQELFVKMYGDVRDAENFTDAAKEKKQQELQALAEEFAAKVKERYFAPAEIQGFLLVRRREPKQAIEEVEAWMLEVEEERKKRGEEEQEEQEKKRKREAQEENEAKENKTEAEGSEKKGGDKEKIVEEETNSTKQDGESAATNKPAQDTNAANGSKVNGQANGEQDPPETSSTIADKFSPSSGHEMAQQDGESAAPSKAVEETIAPDGIKVNGQMNGEQDAPKGTPAAADKASPSPENGTAHAAVNGDAK